MNRPFRTAAVLVAVSLLLGTGGCANNQQVGTAVGAALGGALGAQVGRGAGRTAAIIFGTIMGGSMGGNIGRYMDRQDRMEAAYALEHNRTYAPARWRNPDSGYDYTVTPTRTYYERQGYPCREFTTEAVIDGRRQKVYGTACRDPDGSWRVEH